MVNQSKPIYIVLSSVVGDADIFVNIQPNSNIIKRSDWKLPNRVDYGFKSELALKQDVVFLENSELHNCIEKSKTSKLYSDQDEVECAILMGVYGKPGELSQFDLVGYVNLQQLESDHPIEGVINLDEYQYFIFKVSCDDCTLLIGL